ncbi:hypothetical protein JB92DRAFT_2901303 [Gautieria morchelliformis]|nr:hypothetical protein JB92DRAFT_2901303 [Gautieria morchelliformis]
MRLLKPCYSLPWLYPLLTPALPQAIQVRRVRTRRGLGSSIARTWGGGRGAGERTAQRAVRAGVSMEGVVARAGAGRTAGRSGGHGRPDLR